MSSKVIDVDDNQKRIIQLHRGLLVINHYGPLVTLVVSFTVFEVLTHKARKCHVSPSNPCLNLVQLENVEIDAFDVMLSVIRGTSGSHAA